MAMKRYIDVYEMDDGDTINTVNSIQCIHTYNDNSWIIEMKDGYPFAEVLGRGMAELRRALDSGHSKELRSHRDLWYTYPPIKSNLVPQAPERPEAPNKEKEY
jgi:hypothetical protein